MVNNRPPLVEKYIIGDIIGNGGYSTVYKAKGKYDDRDYALKYFKYRAGQETGQKRVSQEVAILNILNHPNIIQMFDYNIKKTSLYAVFEYCEYGSLTKYNDEGYVNNERVLKKIVTDIARGLSYIHSMCIFHGDLKTDNVMVADVNNPLVKIIDFGNADVVRDDVRRNMTLTGSIFNIPPEVIRYGFRLCEVTDVFALGIIMYTCIYGHRPFHNLNGIQLRHSYQFHTRWDYPKNTKFPIGGNARNLMENLLACERKICKRLMDDPFITLPFIPDSRNHLLQAKNMINHGFRCATEHDFEDSFVSTIEAVMNMYIYLAQNRLTIGRHEKRQINRGIREYNTFTTNLNKLLNVAEYTKNPIVYLRAICNSSPRLSNMIDVGITGEMYYKEGKRDPAINKIREALDEYFQIFPRQPISERKELVEVRANYWLALMTHLLEGGPIPKEP